MPYVFNVLGFSEIFINSEKVKLWFQWKIARLKKKKDVLMHTSHK